jgi:hypothetical protein
MTFEIPTPSQSTAIKAILDCKPPNMLYHYTKRAGLLGIIGERRIYASHIRYLNDANELSHALRLMETTMNRLINKAKGNQKQLYMQIRKQWLSTLHLNNHVYVTSLSADSDSLSQWRAYCGANNGYSIGFDMNSLVQHSTNKSFYIAPCCCPPNYPSPKFPV